MAASWRPKEDQDAIGKAAHLIRELAAAELPDGASEDFPLPGKVTVTAITVTAINGEQGCSVTPDRCTLNIDLRTTHLRGHCGRRAAEPHHRPGRQTLARHPAHPSRGSEQVLIEDGTKLWHYDSSSPP